MLWINVSGRRRAECIAFFTTLVYEKQKMFKNLALLT